jgi:hypothetical protein
MGNPSGDAKVIERIVPITSLDPLKATEGWFYWLIGQGPGDGELWLAVKNAVGVMEFEFIANGLPGAPTENVRMVAGALSSIALDGVDLPEIAGQWVMQASPAATAFTCRAVLTGGPAGEAATLVIENLTTPGVVATLTTASATPVRVESSPIVAVGANQIYQATLVTGTINVPVFLGGLDVLTGLAP